MLRIFFVLYLLARRYIEIYARYPLVNQSVVIYNTDPNSPI